MFAPMIMRMALPTARAPEATMLTMIEVVQDELGTMLVARSPAISPMKGFSATAMSVRENQAPKAPKPVSIRETLRRNP
jgi:hypothetical protein